MYHQNSSRAQTCPSVFKNTSESCSLSEFGRWMFIETGATVVCYLLFRNPPRGLSVHSSLPKNRNLSSLSELELVPLTPPRGMPSPPLFFHNTSFFTVCIACLNCSMLHLCMFTEAVNNTTWSKSYSKSLLCT